MFLTEILRVRLGGQDRLDAGHVNPTGRDAEFDAQPFFILCERQRLIGADDAELRPRQAPAVGTGA